MGYTGIQLDPSTSISWYLFAPLFLMYVPFTNQICISFQSEEKLISHFPFQVSANFWQNWIFTQPQPAFKPAGCLMLCIEQEMVNAMTTTAQERMFSSGKCFYHFKRLPAISVFSSPGFCAVSQPRPLWMAVLYPAVPFAPYSIPYSGWADNIDMDIGEDEEVYKY